MPIWPIGKISLLATHNTTIPGPGCHVSLRLKNAFSRGGADFEIILTNRIPPVETLRTGFKSFLSPHELAAASVEGTGKRNRESER